MESAINLLSKTFQHLAREIQAYIFSGILVVLNTLFITNKLSLLTQKQENSTLIWILAIVITYIIGHVCMAVFSLLFEVTRIQKLFQKIFYICMYGKEELKNKKVESKNNFPNVDASKDVEIYINSREAYQFYIERDNNLIFMRWNYAGAGVLNTVITLFFYSNVFLSKSNVIFINLLFSGLMFLLCILAEFERYDFSKSIESNVEKKRTSKFFKSK